MKNYIDTYYAACRLEIYLVFIEFLTPRSCRIGGGRRHGIDYRRMWHLVATGMR